MIRRSRPPLATPGFDSWCERAYDGLNDEVVRPELGRLPMLVQQALGNERVEALVARRNVPDPERPGLSRLAQANHRGTFLHAVAEQKLWFDQCRSR